IITSQNSGVTWRTDEAGNSFATATPLTGTLSGGVTTVASWGIISRSAGAGANDVDMYSLQVAAGGSINLTVSPWSQVWVSGGSGPTYDASPYSAMDVQVTVYDAALNVVTVINDPARLDATVSLTGLTGGVYYIAIDGVGAGDPLSATPTGFTEYGSIGQYMIRGTYSGSTEAPKTFTLDTSTVTTDEAGRAGSFTITGSSAALVSIAGLDGTEGTAPASVQLVETGPGSGVFRATVTVTGLNDTADDGNQAYALQISAAGYTGATVSVTNLDDDISAATAGARVGSYKKNPTASNANLSALATDDGVAMTLTEGTIGSAARLEWRWSFTNLESGVHTLHLDSRATGEGFRFEYSLNNGTSWTTIGTAPAGGVLANDFAVSVLTNNSTLTIRVMDTVTTADSRRDSVSIDLLTLERDGPLPAPVLTGIGAAEEWHLFG
ncbi:MAG TPA: hypothetical protein VD970_16340, partial [Acetobacteraceae bacterium]|nr:hypothetical protein [Acetobacteraceae bacterium]